MATQYFIISFLLFSSYTLTYATLEEDTHFGHPIDRKLLGLDKQEHLTHFRFYWHEIVGGPNATSIQIVPPVPKYNSTTSFGLVRVIDNALTIGPELTSRLVGRAQGIATSTSQTELTLQVIQSFVFYEGRYNGSVITILGRNVVFDKMREMPVVGGTGVFRFAKGYAEARTSSSDPKSGDTTVQYDVYVSHH